MDKIVLNLARALFARVMRNHPNVIAVHIRKTPGLFASIKPGWRIRFSIVLDTQKDKPEYLCAYLKPKISKKAKGK